MLKELLKYNNASLLYTCSVPQLIVQIKNENLTKEDLEQLKRIIEIHCDKSALFTFVLDQQIGLRKSDKNYRMSVK